MLYSLVMRPRAQLLFLTLLLVFTSTLFAKPTFVPGQLIYRKKSFSDLHLSQTSSVETLIEGLGGSIKKIPISKTSSGLQLRGALTEKQTFLVSFNSTVNLDDVQKKIRLSGDVQWVQKNYLFHLFYTPNDPETRQQWHIDAVHLNNAWDLSKGSSGVIIAVIDSGVDYNHPDLKNRMWTNPLVTDFGDSDGNEQTNDKIGWDFGSNDNDPLDNYGHGTMVAGIAAAQTDNGVGGAGAAFNARILPIKVMDDAENIDTVAVALAVNYAVSQKADVINMSLGGAEDANDKNTLFEEAVRLLLRPGMLA